MLKIPLTKHLKYEAENVYTAIPIAFEALAGGTRMGIIVPGYAPADSIEDLAEYRKEFGEKIMGIEPGQGIMPLTEKAIEEYGLK